MAVFIFSCVTESEMDEKFFKKYKIEKDDIVFASNSSLGAMESILKYCDIAGNFSNDEFKIDYIIVKDKAELEEFRLFISDNIPIFKRTKIIIKKTNDRLLYPKEILKFIISKIKTIQRQGK